MATADQIDRAATTGRHDRVRTGSEHMDSAHLLAMPAADRDYALAEIDRATRAVHRIADDDHTAAEVLEVLGLAPYQRDPAPAPVLKRCTKCGHTKPAAGFYRERTASDGLSPHCKSCRAEGQRAYRIAQKNTPNQNGTR
jgi:hypothetical protein